MGKGIIKGSSKKQSNFRESRRNTKGNRTGKKKENRQKENEYNKNKIKIHNENEKKFLKTVSEEEKNRREKEETNKMKKYMETYKEKVDFEGDFEIDLVKLAFYVNREAKICRDEKNDIESQKKYKIKDDILEYIQLYTKWGKEEPYESFGYSFDKNNNKTLVFDVPCHGQVSFHTHGVPIYEGVERYKYNWKGVKNTEFPSYEKIDNYHDLMFGLGQIRRDMVIPQEEKMLKKDIEEEEILQQGRFFLGEPINLKQLKNRKRCEKYCVTQGSMTKINEYIEKLELYKSGKLKNEKVVIEKELAELMSSIKIKKIEILTYNKKITKIEESMCLKDEKEAIIECLTAERDDVVER